MTSALTRKAQAVSRREHKRERKEIAPPKAGHIAKATAKGKLTGIVDKAKLGLIANASYREPPKSSDCVDIETQADGNENGRFQFSNRNGVVSGATLGLPIKRFATWYHGGKSERRLVSLSSGVKRQVALRNNIADINRKLCKARDQGDHDKVAKLASLRTRQLDTLQALMGVI